MRPEHVINKRHFDPVAKTGQSRLKYWPDGTWKNFRVNVSCGVCNGTIKPHENCFDTGGSDGLKGPVRYCQACAYEKQPTTYGEAEVVRRSRNLGALGLRG